MNHLLESHDPSGKLGGLFRIDLAVGWHGNWSPHAAAAFHDLARQLGYRIGLAGIFGSDVFIGWAHDLFFNSVAGHAILGRG